MPTLAEIFATAARHHQQGRVELAEQLCQQILNTNSAYVDALHLLGVISSQKKNYELAEIYLARAISLKKTDAALYSNLGGVLKSQGKLNDAVVLFRRALELKPDYALAHYNLGTVYQAQNKLDDAAASYRRAIELNSNLWAAHNNLGNVYQLQGKAKEAAECFQRAIQLKPDLYEAHNNLGNMLQAQGQTDEAIASFRRAAELKPDLHEAVTNMGAAFQAQGKLQEAIECYERALKIKPDDALTHHNLATAYQAQWDPDKAAAACKQALEHQPDFADAYANLGIAAYEQGKPEEAVAHYRRALELKPDDVTTHSSLLLALQYQPDVTLAGLADAHAEFERQHAATLRNEWRFHSNDRQPDRPLRLGFVSPDFGRHPVGYFVIRLLENLDRAQWQTTCYSIRRNDDVLTQRFRAASSQWRDAAEMSDAELADKIRADEIDILFDLAGHTAKNRILIFARKPAPIQITWAGYASTTGLAAIDYILSDRYEIPPAAEQHYRERVLRMPDGYVCYADPVDAPQVSPQPALAHGSVTFGSFSKPAKVNGQVIEVWAKILDRLPQSRLILRFRGFHQPTVANRVAHEFADLGIDPRRIDFGIAPPEQLLAEYQAVDVALDPFPYGGGLTTCEALWMGVPVVTCPGETFASRHSLSHLSNVGLTELVARGRDHYVELAVSLANDLPRLAKMRAALREQMAASPLCDGKRFAENLTKLLRDSWREWCESGRSA
jgi:protein O-GlcNAc transferase